MKRIELRAKLGGMLQHSAVRVAVPVALAFGVGIWVSPLLLGDKGAGHAGHGAPSGEVAAKSEVWTCSMHPQVKQPEPGRCPICGMDLIPLKSDDEAPGPNTVVLSERAKTLARIGTTEVVRLKGSGTDLRLLGRIEPSETSMKSVTAWTAGRIDKLHVKVTGRSVRKGQVIATLYSPEVLAAHQDLIVAKKQVGRMAESSESARGAAERALEASRSRLRLLGVPDNEITAMENANKPARQIQIRTPFAGTVMERSAVEGAYVKTGTVLYTVADLSRLWVQLDAYESDLPRISLGQTVEIAVEGISDEVFEGKVTFIDPVLDPRRRTARVRVVVSNKDRRLRPGMFARAEVKSAASEGKQPPLIIPDTAPLFTGVRAIVFVEDSSASRPTYNARTVRLGPKTGEFYPVVAGLSAGERVVTKGAFTLDADLQIRGGNSMMAASSSASGENPVIAVTAGEREKLAPVFDAYLNLAEFLAADDFEKAKAEAARLAERARDTAAPGPAAAAAYWKTQSAVLQTQAGQLAASENMEAARGIFETVSRHVIGILERLGNPLDAPVRLAFCPMAMGSKGASWVQRGEVVDNAYFGDLMRTCGEIKAVVEPGQYLMTEKPTDDRASSASGEGHGH